MPIPERTKTGTPDAQTKRCLHDSVSSVTHAQLHMPPVWLGQAGASTVLAAIGREWAVALK
jgi:hypothetical protein